MVEKGIGIINGRIIKNDMSIIFMRSHQHCIRHGLHYQFKEGQI